MLQEEVPIDIPTKQDSTSVNIVSFKDYFMFLLLYYIKIQAPIQDSIGSPEMDNPNRKNIPRGTYGFVHVGTSEPV